MCSIVRRWNLVPQSTAGITDNVIKKTTKQVRKSCWTLPLDESPMVANPWKVRVTTREALGDVPFYALRYVFAFGHWWSETAELTLLWSDVVQACLLHTVLHLITLCFYSSSSLLIFKNQNKHNKNTLFKMQTTCWPYKFVTIPGKVPAVHVLVHSQYWPHDQFSLHSCCCLSAFPSAGLVSSDSCYGISAAVTTSDPFEALTHSWRKGNKI